VSFPDQRFGASADVEGAADAAPGVRGVTPGVLAALDV
jgi:hypothetical protein